MQISRLPNFLATTALIFAGATPGRAQDAPQIDCPDVVAAAQQSFDESQLELLLKFPNKKRVYVKPSVELAAVETLACSLGVRNWLAQVRCSVPYEAPELFRLADGRVNTYGLKDGTQALLLSAYDYGQKLGSDFTNDLLKNLSAPVVDLTACLAQTWNIPNLYKVFVREATALHKQWLLIRAVVSGFAGTGQL